MPCPIQPGDDPRVLDFDTYYYQRAAGAKHLDSVQEALLSVGVTLTDGELAIFTWHLWQNDQSVGFNDRPNSSL